MLQSEQNYGLGGNAQKRVTGIKMDTHLVINLKRKVKDLQVETIRKNEEVEQFKRHIKSTKNAELEIEIKLYMEECARMRHQLEEVIRSKDTFADP